MVISPIQLGIVPINHPLVIVRETKSNQLIQLGIVVFSGLYEAIRVTRVDELPNPVPSPVNLFVLIFNEASPLIVPSASGVTPYTLFVEIFISVT